LTDGPVFRRIWAADASGAEAVPVLGQAPLTDRSVARIIQARAAAAGLEPTLFGGHSLKRGALTTGMQRGVHPVKLKRLARHRSFATLGVYLEEGDAFDEHALLSKYD
jgi:hypothetical protein